VKHFFATGEHLPGPTIAERVAACSTHFTKSLAWKGPKVGVFEMRRHYANYFKGLPDFKPYRTQLVKEEDISIIYALLDEIAEKFMNVNPVNEMA
jgi:tRNA-dihydrouridine synthase B